jgi:hypothetical protein
VRPHPMQKPVSGSTTQIFMHGVSISKGTNIFMCRSVIQESFWANANYDMPSPLSATKPKGD